MKKYLQTIAGIFILTILSISAIGQQKTDSNSDKEVIVIKKKIDSQGKTIEENVVMHDDEIVAKILNAHKLNFENSPKSGGVWISKDGDEVIELQGDEILSFEEGDLFIDEDGNHKKIARIELAVDKGTENDQRKMIILFTDESGEEQSIEWTDDGTNIPEEIKIKLEDAGLTAPSSEGDVRSIFIQEPHGQDNSKDLETIELKDLDEPLDFHFDFGYFTKPNKVQLGVIVEDTKEGVKIHDIEKDTEAERIGLQATDIILSVNGEAISNSDELEQFIQESSPGDKIDLAYLRRGTEITVKAELQERNVNKRNVEVIVRSCDGNFSSDENINFLFKPLLNDKIVKAKSIVVIKKKVKPEFVIKEVVVPEVREQPENLSRRLELDNFKVYPNPSDGILHISFESIQDPVTVQITDITGKEVFKESVNSFTGYYNKDINLTNYAQGQYILYVIQNEKIHTSNIIVN